MNSWDTDPWSNFCDPNWEFNCPNKWHSGTTEISTPSELAVETHFQAQLGTKNTHLFLPTDGEASYLLLSSLVSLLSSGTVQPENTYSRIPKVTGQIWESQKRISINTNHGYNQHSSPQASLNRSNNKARFSFNQPNRKRWYAKLVDVKHLLHKAFFILTQVLEGLPSKIK